MPTLSVLARFNVTLSVAVSEPVSVDWYTVDGTAKAGVDYAGNKGTVVFAPGQVSKLVDILVFGRAVGAEDRSFFVEMLPPTNAVLGASVGECIIHVDTTGSTPVTQIIVPTGPKGDTGDSAYQTWLSLPGNAGKTEQEFIDSLKPSVEEIAEEVAPLINVGDTMLTAEGTQQLSRPDTTTVKAIARRVAYAAPVKIATVTLADGDNTVGQQDLVGDILDFSSPGLYPRILRGSNFISPQWSVQASGKLQVKSAVAGDTLYVCQYNFVSGENTHTNSREIWARTLADAGYQLVDGSFEKGATLSAVTEAIWHVGGSQCYLWAGALPKTVPAMSNPGSTGGVVSGAWVSVSGKLLSTVLKSTEGAKNVFKGKVNIDAILPHTPEEFLSGDMDAAFAASLAATAIDGRRTLVNGDRIVNSTITIPSNASMTITGTLESGQQENKPAITMGSNSSLKGAKIFTPKRALAMRIDGKSDIDISEIKARGTFVTNDNNFAYAFDILNCTNVNIEGLEAEGYTGGLAVSESKNVRADNLKFSDMKFHPGLVAGAYGVLLSNSKNSMFTRLFYKAAIDGYGRHGFYMAGLNGSINSVLNGAVLDYSEQPLNIQPPGAINIRKNDRAIYANIIIDGTGITGIVEEGFVSAQIFNGVIVNQIKRGAAIAYGINLGGNFGAYRVRNCVFANYLVTISLADGITDQLSYGVVVSGSDNKYNGYTRLPLLGYPYLVENGASDCLIEGCLDTAEAAGGQAFMLFSGSASRITVKGCSTRRPWFRTGNLANVTDLTVDWARSCAVAINAGTPSYEDTNELIASTAVSSTNIVITFNSHVTGAALAAATATTRKMPSMTTPVIVARSGKTLTLEFYSVGNGSLVNPATGACAATITLFS